MQRRNLILLVFVLGLLVSTLATGWPIEPTCPEGYIYYREVMSCCSCWMDTVWETRCYCPQNPNLECYLWTDGMHCIPLDYNG